MPRRSTQYEQAQEKRIIEGAARVFAAYGYRQTTMNQVCQALGLSKGAIYVYFKSKEELFVSVLQTIYDQRFSTLATAFQPEDTVSLKFEKILDRLADLMGYGEDTFIRLWIEGFLECEHIPALQAIKSESRRQFQQLLTGLLQEGQRSGEIDAGLNLSSMVAALLAVADGLMLHSLSQDWGIGRDQVKEILHDSFSRLLKYES